MKFYQLYQSLNQLNTDKVIDQSIDQTLPDLEDINRERMLNGVKSDQTLMPIYSKTSQTVFGKANIRIQLYDTGDFQKAIFSERDGNKIITDSEDYKSEILKQKYGEFIFGTGGEYKRKYIKDFLRPEMNKEITSLIGLKFG
jgi:hypothetical protein